MNARKLLSKTFIVLVIAACADKGGAEAEDPGGTEGGTAGDDPTTTADPVGTTGNSTTNTPPPAGTTGDDPTGGTSSPTPSTDSGVAFIVEPDGAGSSIECDVWQQDCPAGKKCSPWANDGGNAWNASKCTDVPADSKLAGDGCMYEGSAVNGIDNCEASAVCWEFGAESEDNTGTCLPFCTGSPENPQCDDPSQNCNILNEGVLILCLPRCDPTLGECPEGTACYPANAQFSCIPDRSSEGEGDAGSPCEFINKCHDGLFCASATAVPGCTSAGCCSAFCDLEPEGGDPNMPCAEGQECQAYFTDPASAPPELVNVGVCAVPQ